MVRPIFRRGMRARAGKAAAVLNPSAKPCASWCALLRDVSGVGPGVLDGGAPWPTPPSSQRRVTNANAQDSAVAKIVDTRKMSGLLRVAASSNPSVELRANGMPPGPRHSAGVHYL